MERLVLKQILEWNQHHRKPLIVYGARQIGKTYLIRDLFAKRYYKNHFIYIDFKQDDDAREFICGNRENRSAVVDAKKIIEYFSLRENRVIDQTTLLIFDEVQEALPIITALKYFKQDFPEIPVIVSGSMVRMKMKREQMVGKQHQKESFFFPVGAILELEMHPMSFEEFLMNYNQMLYQKIVEAYKNKEKLDDPIHNLAMDALYQYLLVGGMPEDVQMFLDGESLLNIRKNMTSLFDNYLNDMELYQASNESIIRSKLIFNHIYQQLNKESSQFKASLLDKRWKNRDLKTPIDWLSTACVIYKSEQLKEFITLPFMGQEESKFRLYLMDVGFLSYQSDINMSTFVNPTSRNTLSGVFFENYVACELVSKGFPLFYWKGKNDAEFEFILSENGNAIPMDVKKGRGTLNSLKKFKEHNHYVKSIKVSSNHLGIDQETGIITVPFYMVFALLNEMNENKNIIVSR